MQSRTWLTLTICLTVASTALVAGVNAMIDIYGIFRDHPGRGLATYGDHRIAKYLLNERYVPDNFDAVMLGSSGSIYWNLSGAASLRVYNDSLGGANAVEAKTILDQALAHHGIRLVFLIVYPGLTAEHEFKTVRLTPREKIAALGSLSLTMAYLEKAAQALHLLHRLFDESGNTVVPMPTKVGAARGMFQDSLLRIDPFAMAAYKEIISELHARGIPIVFIVQSPTEEWFAPRKAAWKDYTQPIRKLMSAQDKLIDFTSPEFDELRQDRNYVDGHHSTPEAAAQIETDIKQRVNAWVASGELVIPPPVGH
jgi:hypothetical protein